MEYILFHAVIDNMGKIGAKFKLTKKRIEIICGKIEEGVPNKYACVFGGISESGFYNYLALANKLYAEGGELTNSISKMNEKEKLLIEFVESIKKAEAKAISNNIGIIQSAAKTTWTAAAWWLERMHYETFGKKDRHEHTGKDGEPIKTTRIPQKAVKQMADELDKMDI